MITHVPPTAKILDLGAFSERGDILLPIVAQETGRHKVALVEVDGHDATKTTVTTHLVNATKGQPITLKNTFGRENETYILRIKRPNNLLLRYNPANGEGEAYTWFRLRLSANDDPQFGTGHWIHKERVGGQGFTVRFTHAFLQGKEYVYRNGVLQDSEDDYEYLSTDPKAIQLRIELEADETLLATYCRRYEAP